MTTARPPRQAAPSGSGHARGESSSADDADESTAIFRREKQRESGTGTGTMKRSYGGSQTSTSTATVRPSHETTTAGGPQQENATAGAVPSTGAGRRVGVQEESAPSEPEGEAWWKKVAEKYGSVELDNKGSVARDHLALERTFLAWLRTSLAFASIGIAVTQLFRLNTSITSRNNNEIDPGAMHLRSVGKPLGATFLGIAIVVLFVGFHRYFESQHWIIRGKFPASRGSVFIISFIAAALIVVSLVVVVTVDTNAYEN